ncbi:MAG: TIGR03118 family protein [Candidatus Kapaibacterium sp.]
MLRNYRIYVLGAIALLASSCHSSTTPPPVVAPPSFAVTPLAANKASYGVAAANVDTNLQDSWGLAVSAYGGFWIANRASGSTTVYDSIGDKVGIYYAVNGPGGTKGDPTGVVQNTTQAFPVGVVASTWIYSELNGTLAAVQEGGKDSTHIVSSQYASSSSFTGLALVTGTSGPELYAPNVKNKSLDRFDQSFNRIDQISEIHSGYTPFNSVLIDTQLFVTHAMALNGFVAIGPYNVAANGGYVDIYNINGTWERTLISNDSLDSPWGVAIAPSNFGTYSGDLLVGNFGDGTIHAYNRSTGAFIGTLNQASGAPITIPGLWALVVYNGTLYYTAGPNAGTDGVFGTITVK